MISLDKFIAGIGNLALDTLVGDLTPEKRGMMAKGLKDWLANIARKKESMYLASYVQEFNRRIDKMCETLQISMVEGRPVVKVFGSDEATMKALERGTNWFDPCEDVVSVVISALWKS